MISIDNAVELMIKTYLGLPRRVTHIEISRKEYGEKSESFPELLDLLEKYAPNKLEGVDLGEIEWYHRVRNELYHQGNGLTVERSKVEIYAQLARLLFRNLFGFNLEVGEVESEALGYFLNYWSEVEKVVSMLRTKRLSERTTSASSAEEYPSRAEIVPQIMDHRSLAEFKDLQDIRNAIVHGEKTPGSDQLEMYIERTKRLINRLETQLSSMH
jgi:hypothetical protein